MTGKKKMFTGLGILLGILAGAQGTVAYQSAFDTAENVLRPGNITSEIGEDFPNPPTIVRIRISMFLKKYGYRTVRQTKIILRPIVMCGFRWDIQTVILEKRSVCKMLIQKIGFMVMMAIIITHKLFMRENQRRSFVRDFGSIIQDLNKNTGNC